MIKGTLASHVLKSFKRACAAPQKIRHVALCGFLEFPLLCVSKFISLKLKYCIVYVDSESSGKTALVAYLISALFHMSWLTFCFKWYY